jgi:hypothetical protein
MHGTRTYDRCYPVMGLLRLACLKLQRQSDLYCYPYDSANAWAGERPATVVVTVTYVVNTGRVRLTTGVYGACRCKKGVYIR